jgi:hypothetical protein
MTALSPRIGVTVPGLPAPRPRGRRRPGRGECVLADLLTTSHEDCTPLADPEVRAAVLTLLVPGTRRPRWPGLWS